MGLQIPHTEEFGPVWLSFRYVTRQVPRRSKVTGKKFYNEEPVGVEAVLETEDHLIVAIGSVKKHPQDIFNKAVGRVLAMKRLINQLRSLGYPGSFLGAIHQTFQSKVRQPQKQKPQKQK